jgi:hypothetical protein
MHTNDAAGDTIHLGIYPDTATTLQRLGEVSVCSHNVGIVDPELASHPGENDLEFSTALIAMVAKSSGQPPQCLESVKLEHLVVRSLDITFPEAMLLANMSRKRPCGVQRTPEAFYKGLREAIRACGLWQLFTRVEEAEWHRSIVPAAYNQRTGEVHPVEMATWRAYFRTMPPECQMMAATIVWLYRGGDDSIWLRRVPSSWRALEALNYMRDADVFHLWLNLITNYSGW